MAPVQGLVCHTDSDDLYNDAMARTFDGRRKWHPDEVDFVMHLKGCMSSIVSSLTRRAYAELKAMRESERQKAIHTFEHSWPSKILDDTRTHLEEDAIALRVFDLLREGNTPAEVREALRIKDNVYNAARKTISRRMSDLFEGWRTVAKLDMPGGSETESDHA